MNCITKKTLAASIILLICIQASAQTAIEAESYLSRAKTFYNVQDQRNALLNAHLAKLMFAAVGDTPSADRAASFISQIENQTTKPKAADHYYVIGSDYFFSVDGEIDSYDTQMAAYNNAKYFTRLSRQLFEELADKPGELKAIDLMQEAGKKIEWLNRQETAKADSYYSASRTSFLNKDYGMALTHAETALEIYTNVTDEDGIANTNALIDRINAEVGGLKKNGETAIRTAKNFYAQDNYLDALKHAENARALFESINYELGLVEAKDLISIINARLQKTSEEQKIRAASLYRQAQDHLVKLQCEDAIDKVKQSLDIYSTLRKGSETDAEDELYESLSQDASNLLKRIINECGVEEIKKRADLYYKQSQEFYLAGHNKEALSYAGKSKSLHQDIENYVGIAKSQSLMDEITDAINQEKAFSQNMSLARIYLSKADFQNARVHAGLAGNIAANTLSVENKSILVDELIAIVLEREEKLENAKQHYDKAYTTFARGDYKASEGEIKQAITLYRQINHSMGENQSVVLYERIREKTSEISSRKRMTILSIIVVGLVVLVITVNYLKRRKDLERDREMMEQKFKAEKAEEDKIRQIESDKKTKEIADERLREMIEEERKHAAELPPAEAQTPAGPPPSTPTEPPAQQPRQPAPPLQPTQARKSPQSTPPQPPVQPQAPPAQQQPPQAPPATPAAPPETEADEKSLEDEISKIEARLREKEGGEKSE